MFHGLIIHVKSSENIVFDWYPYYDQNVIGILLIKNLFHFYNNEFILLSIFLISSLYF